jgi:hypothetical protein
MNVTHVAGRVVRRLRAEYASPSRIDEYTSILRRAKEAGYALISLGEFVESLRKGKPAERCVILRHDVDINAVGANEAFFRTELAHGAHSTFYFRLSTFQRHARLIRWLREAGFEVGYHFEEGATIAKRRRLASRELVFQHRDEIVGEFRRNCDGIRAHWNSELRSVCAHGDWINRKLGFTNNELIDRRVLDECGLEFEAYDSDVRAVVDVYLSDAVHLPERWRDGVTPFDAIENGSNRIYILTHDGRWHPDRLAKASAEASRIWDLVRFAGLGR